MIRFAIVMCCLLPLTMTSTTLADEAGATSWKDVYNSGQKAMDDGDYAKALEILAQSEKSATSAAGKAPAANGQGLALLRSRKYAEAIPHFERALKHDSNYLISRKNLGYAHVKMYALGLADKSVLEKAVEVLSSVPEGEASSLGEAKALLDLETKWAAAAASPAEPAGKTWRELADEGNAAESEGRFDHALKCFVACQAISKTSPSKAAACNLQGLTLMKARKFEEAMGHLEEACKTGSSNKTFLGNMGLCHLRLYEKNAEGDHLTPALEALRKVKEMDPSYKPESLALAEEYAAKAGMGKAEEKDAEPAAEAPAAK